MYGAGVAGILSPYIAGLISDKYGIHSVFIYGGVVLILPTILLAVTRFAVVEGVSKYQVKKTRVKRRSDGTGT